MNNNSIHSLINIILERDEAIQNALLVSSKKLEKLQQRLNLDKESSNKDISDYEEYSEDDESSDDETILVPNIEVSDKMSLLSNVLKMFSSPSTNVIDTTDLETNTIILAKYDLSRGIAKQISGELIDKTLEGIWHTGIRVFGKEYYFGTYGIAKSTSEEFMESRNIKPHELIIMGDTNITQEEFEEYLDSLTMGTYDIINNNCNHFSQKCLEFLDVKLLPEDLLNQHLNIMNTPMWPFIETYLDFSRSSSLI